MPKQLNPYKALTVFKDSARKAPIAKKGKQVAASDSIEVTLRIRRKKSIESALKELETTGKTYTREEYQQTFGLSDEDVKKVESFAAEAGLSVVHTSYSRRCMMLKGTAENISKAFGVTLHYYTAKSKEIFHGRSGTIKIPTALNGIVEGVFGLDTRPQATPKFIRKKIVKSRAVSTSYNPNQLATIYDFPQADGTGQVIGILEFGGGHTVKDLTHYFNGLKLPVPVVKSVSVGTGHNKPGGSADDEVMLDIEVAGAIAPKATIVMYYAPNSTKGFIDAITQAVHDDVNKPTVISISWGAAESDWTTQAKTNFNEVCKAAALLGVTICLAAGDAGSDDGVGDGKAHVDFPSSCPYVLACGGTKLFASNNKITSEVVWHESNDSATGGGVSEFFALPDYQQKAGVPVSVNTTKFKGRGVPDLAGVADPETGYNVYVQGKAGIIGGTSAVAPLVAGLIARINQLKGKPVGFIQPKIYAAATAFRDITDGNNITTSTGKGYSAGKGWDACTGMGVADGKKLLGIL
ncbi:MAG: S53 family peptidase [Chitinophagaceae bacterium]